MMNTLAGPPGLLDLSGVSQAHAALIANNESLEPGSKAGDGSLGYALLLASISTKVRFC